MPVWKWYSCLFVCMKKRAFTQCVMLPLYVSLKIIQPFICVHEKKGFRFFFNYFFFLSSFEELPLEVLGKTFGYWRVILIQFIHLHLCKYMNKVVLAFCFLPLPLRIATVISSSVLLLKINLYLASMFPFHQLFCHSHWNVYISSVQFKVVSMHNVVTDLQWSNLP